MMKKYCGISILVVLTALSFFLFGWDSTIASEKKEIAIQVNGCKISLDEFNDMIKFEVYADPEMELTTDTRDRFIKYLVRKELLIQEASKLKLDTTDEFIQTIEKYWEATLIRTLLDLKSADLRKQVLVTVDEIKAYHGKNKEELGPFTEEVKESIKCILEARKLEAKLENWTQSLGESADITINEALINGN
jgi:hypothetical protein